jgi:hypothetical protein
MPVRRAVAVALVAAGCGAASARGPAVRPGPTVHDADWVTRTCAREYRTSRPRDQATSPFAHCPRWRMAAPDACGADVQPSFFDPCHCMCDLCESDADCGAGASCVSLSSVVCGGLDERVCVKKTDVCHPDNAPKRCPTYCVTLLGAPECVSKADRAMCEGGR